MTYLVPRNIFGTPFGHLGDWTKDLDKMFHNFDDVIERNATHRACDVVENDNNYEVHIEVPGLTRDNIEVEFLDEVLTVKTHLDTKHEEAGDNTKHHRMERIHKEGFRQFRFPTTVDADTVEATCENGLLTIKLPKIAPKKAKKIHIDALEDAQ